MTRGQRAAQIWSLLALCAGQRQTLTYDQLSKLIGVFRPGLGQLLEPIQSYCLLKGLPPLTSLVVSEADGMPGAGFIAASDLPPAHARVYAHKWTATGSPQPEAFEAAVLKLP